jgi:hypothetical protein
MNADTVLAEICFLGSRAGRWRSMPNEAFAAHIVMAGQIWMGSFIPALTSRVRFGENGETMSGSEARAAIRHGWRDVPQARTARSGTSPTSDSALPDRNEQARYELDEPAGIFMDSDLEEVANSAHCGGPSCGYGFRCYCSCAHCGGARKLESET